MIAAGANGKETTMKIILETERLLLREFGISDTSFIIELVNSPGWLAYIGDRNIKTAEQAQTYLLNGPIKSYAQNGFGLWLVALKTELVPIGMCGILKRETLDNPDIGFAFLPEYTGKGYAFESAAATMAFAKDVLQLSTISAITVPENKASINLLEKVGLKLIKPFQFEGKDEKLLLYSN